MNLEFYKGAVPSGGGNLVQQHLERTTNVDTKPIDFL